jgi:hypothetical protein
MTPRGMKRRNVTTILTLCCLAHGYPIDHVEVPPRMSVRLAKKHARRVRAIGRIYRFTTFELVTAK